MADRSRFGHAAMLMFEHALECRGALISGAVIPGAALICLWEAKAWDLSSFSRRSRSSSIDAPVLGATATGGTAAEGVPVDWARHVPAICRWDKRACRGVVGVAARTGQAVADRLFLRRDFGYGPERRTTLRHRWSGGSSGLFPGLCGSSAFHRSDGPGGALRAAFTLSLNSRLVECPKAMHVGAWPR